MSSQNLICVPVCKLKQPKLRNWSFTLIKRNQKSESPGFFITWTSVMLFRYLFLRNSWQIPSTLHNLNSHLLSRHLFCKFRFCMPKPPCSFGWHKIFHLTSLYFFLCWTSKNDIMNIGKLDRIELINTSLPATDNNLPFHQLTPVVLSHHQ
jgi:hypothetical protein